MKDITSVTFELYVEVQGANGHLSNEKGPLLTILVCSREAT